MCCTNRQSLCIQIFLIFSHTYCELKSFIILKEHPYSGSTLVKWLHKFFDVLLFRNQITCILTDSHKSRNPFIHLSPHICVAVFSQGMQGRLGCIIGTFVGLANVGYTVHSPSPVEEYSVRIPGQNTNPLTSRTYLLQPDDQYGWPVAPASVMSKEYFSAIF